MTGQHPAWSFSYKWCLPRETKCQNSWLTAVGIFARGVSTTLSEETGACAGAVDLLLNQQGGISRETAKRLFKIQFTPLKINLHKVL